MLHGSFGGFKFYFRVVKTKKLYVINVYERYTEVKSIKWVSLIGRVMLFNVVVVVVDNLLQ